MPPFAADGAGTTGAFVLVFLLPTILAYLYAAHRAQHVRQMLHDWPRRQATVVANEERQTRRGTVYVPTVEWSPEGEPVFFAPADRRSEPWVIGEKVTLLRDPEDWRKSRILDPDGLYWREVWSTVISGTLPLLGLLAWALM